MKHILSEKTLISLGKTIKKATELKDPIHLAKQRQEAASMTKEELLAQMENVCKQD